MTHVIRFGLTYVVQPGFEDCSEKVRAVIDECLTRSAIRTRGGALAYCTRRLREEGLTVRTRSDIPRSQQQHQPGARGGGSAA